MGLLLAVLLQQWSVIRAMSTFDEKSDVLSVVSWAKISGKLGPIRKNKQTTL